MSTQVVSKLSIAPMIDWTYSHFRVFMRLLAPQALVYTEMQTTGAIQNNPARALEFLSIEHPIALQLGGSDPKALAYSAKEGARLGFDEVNLNLGCPSDKVQAGRFGACLMYEPDQVVACIRAMKDEVSIPVTAKTRIGVDNHDSYAFFSDFAHRLVEAGCDQLIVHARKAWLSGLNPKQNRTIPPIHYDVVYRLKQELPHIPIIINGNISTDEGVLAHLEHVDGVMLGRLACDNPYRIACIHHMLYPESPLPSRSQVFAAYHDYLVNAHLKGVPLSVLIKPIFNFTHGIAGASSWRKKLMHILQSKNVGLFDALYSYLEEQV